MSQFLQLVESRGKLAGSSTLMKGLLAAIDSKSSWRVEILRELIEKDMVEIEELLSKEIEDD
jgi:hypothetical protein